MPKSLKKTLCQTVLYQISEQNIEESLGKGEKELALQFCLRVWTKLGLFKLFDLSMQRLVLQNQDRIGALFICEEEADVWHLCKEGLTYLNFKWENCRLYLYLLCCSKLVVITVLTTHGHGHLVQFSEKLAAFVPFYPYDCYCLF